MKHVIRENGFHEDDIKNVHDVIRIPGSSVEYLKVFKCLFCPGADGMKFVGLSEETFLDHIHNKHGHKVPRKRPEKLRRECRICAENFETDAELSHHINIQHIRNKKVPFAGVGPKDLSDESEDSDDSDIQSVVSQGNPNREVLREIRPPPPPPMRASNSQRTSRSWNEETERFLDNVKIPAASRRSRNQEFYNSSDDEDETLYQSGAKRMRIEGKSTSKRPSCSGLGHPKQFCFTCPRPGCEDLSWLRLQEAVEHVRTSRGHVSCGGDTTELLAGRHILPPAVAESLVCHYCSPPHLILGADREELRTKLYEHMELHDRQHRGSEREFMKFVRHGCRLCDKEFTSEVESDKHMERHKRSASKRSATPRSAEKRRMPGGSGGHRPMREDGELRSPSPARPRRSSGVGSTGEKPRDPRHSSSSTSVVTVGDGDKFGCQRCGAMYDEVAHLNKHLVRQHGARDDPDSLMAHSIYPKDLRYVC